MKHATGLGFYVFLMLSLAAFGSFTAAQEAEPYSATIETGGGITLYGYGERAYVLVYDDAGNLVWEGALNDGERQTLDLEPGTYECVGQSPDPTFGVIPDNTPPGEKFPQKGETPAKKLLEGLKGNGSLTVICVPWQGNPFLSHDTYDGKQITLKGTIKGTAGVAYTYTWDFGDGSPVAAGAVTDPYIIQAKHTYSGVPVGTSFRAKLVVAGDDGSMAEDEYPITVRPNTLDAKVNIAIDEGLWYLHKRMYRWSQDNGGGPVEYGRIPNGTGASNMGYHGQAMEAYQNQGHLVLGDPDEDPYVEDVQRGLNWILRNVSTYNVASKQHAGYAEDYDNNGVLDDNGNGIGLSASGTYMYTFGITCLALASSRAPDQLAAPVGRANVDGRPYRDIVQDMADFAVWSQNDYSSSRRGGWRYNSNYGNSDNSVSQWPVLALFAAESLPFDAKIAPWAKDETRAYWIPRSQSSNGGFGYLYAGYWNNVAKTGAGLILLSWVGTPPADARVSNAKAFINGQWNRTTSTYTNIGDFYSMYGVMKGARLTDPQIEFFGAHDWYEEYATWLVNHQEAGGYWIDRSWLKGYLTYDMSTAWAILILTPTVFKNPPTANLTVSPNPTDRNIDVLFDGSASYVHPAAPEGTTIVKYEFNFGDGTTYTETVDSAPDGAFDGMTTHSYSQYHLDAGYPEGYPASLKVADSQEPPQVSAPVSVKVKIVPPDHPPTAIISVVAGAWESGEPGIDFEAYSGSPVTFDGSQSYDINERDGDIIVSYEWDFTAPTTFDDPVPGIQAPNTWTILGDTPHTFDVGLRVTDRGNPLWNPPGPLQGFDFAKILVHPNAPPIADAGPDQTVECACNTVQGTKATLNGTNSSDPNGDTLTFLWTGPFAESPATGPTPTVTLIDGCPGVYEVILVVSDGKVDSEPDAVVITVVDRTPPAVTCRGDVTLEAVPGLGGAPVFVPAAVVSDACDGAPVVVITDSSGRTLTPDTEVIFPPGGPGEDPRETTVTYTATDASGNQGTCQFTVTVLPFPVEVDIKPGSCPNPLTVTPKLNTKGVMSVAVMGTEDFDVTTILPESLQLEGVVPYRWSLEDVATPLPDSATGYCECHELGSDGYLDLVLKFPRGELEQVLFDDPPGDLPGGILPIIGLTIPLTLTGQTMTGEPFEGQDCIRVQLRGDANKDGKLDIGDAINLLIGLFGTQGLEVDPEVSDANGDGTVDVADAIALLQELF